jgi:hypothetical protein
MLAKVQMPSLVSTISTHEREELNVVEGSECNYFCPILETNISRNDGKGVANCIMGSSAFVAMNTT